MPRAIVRDPLYRGCRHPADVIEQCVRWYITYRLSYRDLVAILMEREITVSHTTILRWVQKCVPEYERRWARFARPSGRSWRMDETVIKVGGVPHWLYRAVDRDGASVHSMLSNVCNIAAAQAFFQGAVARQGTQWPTAVNIDGNAGTLVGLNQLARDDRRWRNVTVRRNRYVNNLIEQDHRAVKRRSAAMHGLKSFGTAAIALAGVELAHRIHKRQFDLPAGGAAEPASLKESWRCALSEGSEPGMRSMPDCPPTHQFSSTSPDGLVRPARRLGRRHFSMRMPYGNGLYLQLTPHGGRYWHFRYRSGGRRRVLSLGVYPLIDPATARYRHAKARRMLQSGIDPASRSNDLRCTRADIMDKLKKRAGAWI